MEVMSPYQQTQSSLILTWSTSHQHLFSRLCSGGWSHLSLSRRRYRFISSYPAIICSISLWNMGAINLMEKRLMLKSALLGHTIPPFPPASVQSPGAFVALAQSVRGLLGIESTRAQHKTWNSTLEFPELFCRRIYCFSMLASFIFTL